MIPSRSTAIRLGTHAGRSTPQRHGGRVVDAQHPSNPKRTSNPPVRETASAKLTITGSLAPRPMYVIRMTCSAGDTTATEYANAGGKQPSAPRARSTGQPLQLTRIRNRSNFQCSLVPIGCNRHFERLILAIGLTTIEFSCLSVGSPDATLALQVTFPTNGARVRSLSGIARLGRDEEQHTDDERPQWRY